MRVIKYVLILLLLGNFSYVYGQEVEVNKIEDDSLVYIINHLKELSIKQSDELYIKVFSVENLPGSAGYANCEITHDFLIAVSEYGSFPDQSLFRISSFYNPKIKRWNTEEAELKLVIEFGPYDERKEQGLRIGLQKIELE